MIERNSWAVVLAAGEGTRLRSLTTAAGGVVVPKQFCSLRGGTSLLEDAQMRAAAVAPAGKVLTVVSESHREWWASREHGTAAMDIVVQPANRGTAVGVLLPLIHLLRRDARAQVVILPSDHFVRDEDRLAESLRELRRCAREDAGAIFLLGSVPEELDPDLGYIVPGEVGSGGTAPVRQFVEKPPAAAARTLVRDGALLNMFILAASAQTLLRLYAEHSAGLVSRLTQAVIEDEHAMGRGRAVARLYEELPSLDFSRDLLEGREGMLRVLAAPRCGWSDLGTPRRVGDVLHRQPPRPAPSRGGAATAARSALLSLADQYLRVASQMVPS